MKWALMVVLLVAAALRLWNIDLVGISHWDAGSYTAGTYGVGPYGKAYILPYYAPPLMPTLCWLAFEALARTDTVAVMLTALIGIATVGLLFSFARSLYGGAVALVATASLAGMSFHVIFSRQPLADVAYTLLFMLAVHALWKGWWRGQRYSFLSAGVWTGACVLTKYHGFFPLVVFAGLLLLSKLATDHRRHPEADLIRGLKGLLLAGIVSAIPVAWLAWDIGTQIGFEEFRTNRSQWMPEVGLWLIPQVGTYLAQCLTAWVSWVVLVPAALGFGLMLWRRESADLLLLIWTGLFLATLPLYSNYPRLLLPLLPPLALASGLGACTLVVGLRRLTGRAQGKTSSFTAVSLCALVLAAGSWDGRRALTVSDRGYANAAAWLAQQGPSALPDLLMTQHSILFYLGGGQPGGSATNGFLTYDEPEALQVLREGRFRFLVADLRELTLPGDIRAALDDQAGHLHLVKTLDNPLPEPFVVNLEGFSGLAALHSEDTSPAAVSYRNALTSIRIWRHEFSISER